MSAKPKVCLCLTGKTIAEDIKTAERYKGKMDLVELRADALLRDERFSIRHFPEKVGVPAILTIRRIGDGGFWNQGEGARTSLFASALAFPDRNPQKNFAYVDFEEDFHIPCLQDAALAFGTTIIRSQHDFSGHDLDLQKKIAKLQILPYEIPKIAVTVNNLADAAQIYEKSKAIDGEKIIVPMGNFGKPLRVLSQRLGSFLLYTCAPESLVAFKNIGQIDIDSLFDALKSDGIDSKTRLFAVTGNPLEHSRSPRFHNEAFFKSKMNARYIMLPAMSIHESLAFADCVGICGMSVTSPFKESVVPLLSKKSDSVAALGSCNTIMRFSDGWHGWNTDFDAILAWLKNFAGASLRRKKVSLIGAGGAAKSIAFALKTLGAKACVFNRHAGKARNLAEKYGFKWSALGDNDEFLLRRYSDIVINATTCGMTGCESIDPIPFYNFSGDELAFDAIYEPDETPFLRRAKEAGCKTENGLSFFLAQAEMQNEIFCENVCKTAF